MFIDVEGYGVMMTDQLGRKMLFLHTKIVPERSLAHRLAQPSQ